MTDIWLPSWLGTARARISYLDSTGVSRNPYNGQVRTASIGGDKLSASLEFTPQGGSATQMERAALISWLASMRGRQNRVYLSDASHRRRGSFPAAELLANGTFQNGTSGWTTSTAGQAVLTAADRVLRITRASYTSTTGVELSSSVAVTQYAPYVARAMVYSGRGALSYDVRMGATGLGAEYGRSSPVNSNTPGLASAVGVPYANTVQVGVADSIIGVTKTAGDFSIVPFISLSRCALADSRPTLLVRSDEFDHAAWVKTRCSTTANSGIGPDGTTTAESIAEDSTASSTHFVRQSVTVAAEAADYAFSVAIWGGTRQFALLEIATATGSASVSVNLSTGALSSAGAIVSMSNARAFAVSLGSGWWRVCLVARKTSAETSLSASVYLSTGMTSSDATYSGNGSGNINLWRGTLARSSVPTALRGSTATEIPSGFPQSGSAINIKGLPASSDGLLLPGDQVEIITSRGSELKIVTASLNSDAAGLGYLQFEPPLRSSLADNAPIIVHQPMGRFIFTGESPQWLTEPGLISTASVDLEEA